MFQDMLICIPHDYKLCIRINKQSQSDLNKIALPQDQSSSPSHKKEKKKSKTDFILEPQLKNMIIYLQEKYFEGISKFRPIDHFISYIVVKIKNGAV